MGDLMPVSRQRRRNAWFGIRETWPQTRRGTTADTSYIVDAFGALNSPLNPTRNRRYEERAESKWTFEMTWTEQNGSRLATVQGVHA
jgi:hypothetical protein